MYRAPTDVQIPITPVIDYLDAHQGAFTALLTAVLIAVTVYYAIQNRRMVAEMQLARESAILPKLAIEFHRLGPATVTVAIRNVGPGAAFAVDVRIVFKPIAAETAKDERRWRKNVLSSGEQRDFMPPGGLSDNINSLPATYAGVSLTGTMKDASGKTHLVDEHFLELADWRDALSGARERFLAADPERRLAQAFGEQIDKSLTPLGGKLDQIASGLAVLRDPPGADDDP